MGSYVPRPKRLLDCAVCGSRFSGNGNAKYCSSRCRNKYRDSRRGPHCVSCGIRMYASRTVAAQPTCQPCRRSRPAYRDRVARAQIQSWECGACGAACSRPAARGQRPKWCETCRRALQNRDIKIRPADRVAVYCRDAWTCWLCLGDVDRTLIGSYSHWRPSLDHVVPRSRGGSDALTNLRLAHWWCNSVRSDGRSYSPEAFRVPA